MKQSYLVVGGIIGIVLLAAGAFMLMGQENGKGMSKNNTVAPSPTQTTSTKTMENKTIVDIAVEAGNFTTLVAAVKAADLVETLSGNGPFTVFAPTDEAFKKLPAGTVEALLKDKTKLAQILTYHVVSGKVMAKDVVNLKSAKTVQGQEITVKVEGGKVMVDNANVVKTDIEASNGVIHVIDSVILPK